MAKFMLLWPLACLLTWSSLPAQSDFYQRGDYTFTEADTLRGALRPERTCYDVTFYELDIRIDPVQRSLAGYVDIYYRATADFRTLQIDLYENMTIDRIEWMGLSLPYRRLYQAVFVDFPTLRPEGERGVFRVYYAGKPTVAANPPWDGGFVWSTDAAGDPWIGVACEGDGASLWWPNKDHLSDEPDSMSIRVAVPRELTCVANGRLRGTTPQGDYVRYDWFVSYPINNYNVTVNIANYRHFSDTYTAQDGDTLALDYYVLPENLEKAKQHFRQAPGVLACFEKYFGKYPFWRDGYALVETPYLGMEHQGAIAYGNGYQRGYLGGMIPAGMDWDYIIVHESAHEYFGNSISCADLAEMWLHESFATYMEALYIECRYSYADAVRYMGSQRYFIYNQEPILGPPDVNWEDWTGSDHYYKGAWMLHTLRHAIHDDDLWWRLLHGFYEQHAVSITHTEDFISYVNTATGTDYRPFFEQYLRYPSIPVLEYKIQAKGKKLSVRCRWKADAPGFHMPVLVGRPDAYQLIHPTADWQEFPLEHVTAKEFSVATELFLIDTKQVR